MQLQYMFLHISLKLLQKYHLHGIVTVTYRGEVHRDGEQRWGVAGYQCDADAWQGMIDHLGWQV